MCDTKSSSVCHAVMVCLLVTCCTRSVRSANSQRCSALAIAHAWSRVLRTAFARWHFAASPQVCLKSIEQKPYQKTFNKLKQFFVLSFHIQESMVIRMRPRRLLHFTPFANGLKSTFELFSSRFHLFLFVVQVEQ